MPKIRLYQTKLDANNRMGSLQEYDSYLSTVQFRDYTFRNPYTNKSGSLYITDFEELLIDRDYSLFNYALIETVTGEELPAFVRLVPLATKGYRVDVNPDYWAQLLKFNRGGNAIDLHGKCIRSHVNEWEEYDEETNTFSKPTLKNTYLTQEETYSNYAFKQQTMPYIGKLGENMTLDDIKRTKYIYIYIENPSLSDFTVETVAVPQAFTAPYYKTGPYAGGSVGLTICGVISDTGWCSFNYKVDPLLPIIPDLIINEQHLSSLTAGFITSMFITEIPPVVGTVISKVQKNDKWYYYVDYTNTRIYGVSTLITTGVLKQPENEVQRRDFPSTFLIPHVLDMTEALDVSTYDTVFFKNIYSSSTCVKSNDKYSNIVKSKSFVYQPIEIIGNIIDTINTKEIYVSLTPDGSAYYVYFENDNIILNSALSCYPNNRIFAPDTVRDYWTTMNAKRAATSAELNQYNALTQFRNSIASTGNSIMSIFNSKNKIELIGNAYSAGVSSLNTIGEIPPTVMKSSIAEIDFEMALKQMCDGITRSNSSAPYYTNATYEECLCITKIMPSDYAIEKIEEQLHRYGCSTFLLLEDVLSNHKREKFNYIQCSQVEVHGADIDLAEDVISMFQNGVHLWHTNDVGNYDTTNYQVNV